MGAPVMPSPFRSRSMLARLAVAVVVAGVEDGAGVDAVGEQRVQAELLVEAVVLADVAEQEAVGELERGQRADDLDVEHERVAAGRDRRSGSSTTLMFDWRRGISRALTNTNKAPVSVA